MRAFVPGVNEKQPGWQRLILALPAILKDGKRELAPGQIRIVVEFHAQLAFQRLDDFLVEFVDQFFSKWLQGGVAPHLTAGVGIVGGAGLRVVRHGQDAKGFVR